MSNLTPFRERERERESKLTQRVVSFLKKESDKPYFFAALFFGTLLFAFLILNLVFGWNPPTASQPNPAGQTLYSDSSNNIGIGTLYPGSKLEVFSTSSDSILKLSRGPSSSTSTILKLGTDSAFIIQNQSTDAFTIKSGNVGIGTTSPGVTLDVNGKIRSSNAFGATGGGLLYKDNTDYLFLGPTSGGQAYGAYINIAGSTNTDTSAGAGGLTFGTTGASPAMVIKATTGNVGIKTTSPQRALEVADQVRISNGSYHCDFLAGYSCDPAYDVTLQCSNGSCLCLRCGM